MKLSHLIIGAGRSGTTSLVAYLKQHPQINFSQIKEVPFFSLAAHYERGAEYLHSFFSRKDGLLSTSDTYLLIDKKAPQRIFDYNPTMKFTVILRNPTARTYSSFQYAVNNDYINENTDFIESEKLENNFLESSDIINQNNHCNFYGSLYHKHLSYWLKYFPKEQFFICTTQELNENPQDLMNRYVDFLGLQEFNFQPLEKQNKASTVKNKSLNQFLVNRNHWLRRAIRKPLQLAFLRKIVLKSNVVEKIKSKNRKATTYNEMTEIEKDFCRKYFEEDLNLLKRDFGITI